MPEATLSATGRSVCRVLFVSGVPETGCTSIAANAAIAAAGSGTQTLLIDGSIADAATAELFHGPANLALLPPSAGPMGQQHWDTPPAELGSKVLVICDAGTDSRVETGDADRVVVVTNAEPAALDPTYACIKHLAYSRGVQGIGLVVNRAGNHEQAAAQAERLSTLAEHFLGTTLPLLAWLPESPEVGRAALSGSAFVLENPQCEASRAVELLGEDLGLRFPLADLSNQKRISK